MNRTDFQELAELRLREARVLLGAGFAEGAYYLAGYTVECALKACIAKRTREHDFPDKKSVNESHTHNLRELFRLADLKVELEMLVGNDPAMALALDHILAWSEASRYERNTQDEATALLNAIENQYGGLLPWIRQHW